MDETDKAAREREFDVLMARAGVTVMPDRRAGVLAGVEEMRSLAALLRQKRTAASEPSNIFSLVPYFRILKS